MTHSISTTNPPLPQELMVLFNQTTWAKQRTATAIETLLARTDTFAVIRDRDKVIGYGRAITDGVCRAFIDDIVIDEYYRKKGLGTALMYELIQKLQDVEEIYLNTGTALNSFYEKFGFKRAECHTMKLIP